MMGHRSSPKKRTQRSFLCKGVLASHFKGWQVCFNPSSTDPQAHSSHESDSFVGSRGFRHCFSISQHSGGSFKITDLCSGPSWTSGFRAYGLETRASAIWSQRCPQIVASSLFSDHDQQHGSDEVRLMHIPQERSLGSCSACGHGIRRWLGHVRKCSNGQRVHLDDSGRVHPQACELPHFTESGRVSGEDKARDSRMPTSQWSSLRRSLMSCSGSLKSLAKAQPHDSNFKLSQKIKRLNVTKSFNKSSAFGKLLWMAQLRDDLKYPVKEHSRSLISPQDQDIKHLIRLLKHVNQTRDFVFVMEPQLPSGIRKASFRFRLSAIQIQIGQIVKIVKNHRSQ